MKIRGFSKKGANFDLHTVNFELSKVQFHDF